MVKNMRAILEFPQIDKKNQAQVATFIEQIVGEIASGLDCSKTLKKLSTLTGKKHNAAEFAEYWGWTDLETLVEMTVTPEPPYVPDLTRAELEEIIAIIQDCCITLDDNKMIYYEELLHKSLPLTDVSSYITVEETTSEIADKMLRAASEGVILL